MKAYSKIFAALSALSIMITIFFPLTAQAETLPEPEMSLESETLPEPEMSLEADIPAPTEAPPFNAVIEYSMGYVVKGAFTEFPSDIAQVLPMYSLDGENWQECIEELAWDLDYLNSEDAGELERLQNQICLYGSMEPLNSYLAEELDCFYLKLRLTKENGVSYESQAAVIIRENPQPAPEEIIFTAAFAPSIRIFERNPYYYYGKYQLTISADATVEDIASFLPDTLPIEVQLEKENHQYVASTVIDCPITWKPISLPALTAGESVIISDAAEEIIIPSGTLLSTPIGNFQLEEALYVEQDTIMTDDVMLVLNVVSENEAPTGVLSAENAGLEIAFDLKPTGATAIRAYVFSDDAPEWTELPNLPLLEAVNAQPSTANSGYTFVLDSAQEPYCSYLAAKTACAETEPFFIGLEIEGGVYHDRQLILAWPDNYELPPDLTMDGLGGNENNAGADNKNDSTAQGQRPDLPQDSENTPESKTEAKIETAAKTEAESEISVKATAESETKAERQMETAITVNTKTDTETKAASDTTAAPATEAVTEADIPTDSTSVSVNQLDFAAVSKATNENDTAVSPTSLEENSYDFPRKTAIAITALISITTVAAISMISGIPKKWGRKSRLT